MSRLLREALGSSSEPSMQTINFKLQPCEPAEIENSYREQMQEAVMHTEESYSTDKLDKRRRSRCDRGKSGRGSKAVKEEPYKEAAASRVFSELSNCQVESPQIIAPRALESPLKKDASPKSSSISPTRLTKGKKSQQKE